MSEKREPRSENREPRTENQQPTTETITERTTTTERQRSENEGRMPYAPTGSGNEGRMPYAPTSGGDAGYTDLDAANAEIRRLRDENANRRVGNRDLQQQIDALKQQVPTADVQQQIADLQGQLNRWQAASAAGVSPDLLAASEALRSARTPEEMVAANEQLQRVVGSAQPTATGTRNPAPPNRPTQSPTLEQQIQAAEASGNLREALRLKTEKLVREQNM